MNASGFFSFNSVNTNPRFAFAWLVVLLLVGYSAFWNGTGAQYFNDNYQHAYDIKPLDPLKIFLSPNPYHPFYRPLEANVHIASQKLFGLNSTPIILFLVTVHGLLAWIIWMLVRSSGFSRLRACCASVLTLTQSNMYDVDTVACVSNVLSVFFGMLSLVLAAGAGASFSWRHVLAFLCLALSLLSKESGTAYAGMLILILIGMIESKPLAFSDTGLDGSYVATRLRRVCDCTHSCCRCHSPVRRRAVRYEHRSQHSAELLHVLRCHVHLRAEPRCVCRRTAETLPAPCTRRTYLAPAVHSYALRNVAPPQ